MSAASAKCRATASTVQGSAIAPSSLAVEPLANAADDFAFDEVEALVGLVHDEEALLTPAVFLDDGDDAPRSLSTLDVLMIKVLGKAFYWQRLMK
ncbi:hypothetical protein [Eleftheria terrae]|uniref:hypothetical protein n=1 Tax=Eleftheria terrae TaxID=1597781 RepID=UPI00263B151E|nr:hypothetical protein [Eleftheria terrae]WKB56216.1 hypothetical protein N7L95_27250 [Eleftheria terrae]